MGNVLFTENVAEFYRARQLYKSSICDSIAQSITDNLPFRTLKGTLNFDYSIDAILSCELLNNMQQIFAECKQMMNISDQELDSYRSQREQMEKILSEEKTLLKKKVYIYTVQAKWIN